MEKEIFEASCYGHQGRSPVQELLIRNDLRQKNELSRYDARSSGTGVAGIKAGKVPIDFKIGMIQRAINERSDLSLYSPTEIDGINKAIAEGNDRAITRYFDKALTAFVQEERAYRQEVLPMFGIEGELAEEQEQTIVRPDTVAFFAMDQKVLDAARKIYDGAEHQPEIMDIGIRYATGVDDAQVPNTFGQPKEAYIKMIGVQREIVPKMVDMALEELAA